MTRADAGWTASFLRIAECGAITGPAVAIDVLRAFTTAAWAFDLGAERIVLTDDLAEALAIKARIPGSLALKDGEPAPGFDLSNSPAQLRERTGLKGVTIVQRTTAGTVGAVAARHASVLYCASFVCAAATATALRRLDPGNVSFVVTGSDGAADEDRAGAEYIAALLNDPSTPARPYLDRVPASDSATLIAKRIAAGERGVDPRDVAICMEANRFDFAMIAREEHGLLTLRREQA